LEGGGMTPLWRKFTKIKNVRSARHVAQKKSGVVPPHSKKLRI
jgi:hypothetical protein